MILNSGATKGGDKAIEKVIPTPSSFNGTNQEGKKVDVRDTAIQNQEKTDTPIKQPVVSVMEQVEPKQKSIGSLTDFTNEIYKNRMPSEEDLIKEGKREKARSVIAAIADGVSAISNLYFTGKGAQNVEQTSMSKANTKRYQEILDKRKKMQGDWDNARLSAYDRDRGFNRQKDLDDANWKRSGEWHDDQVARGNAIYKDDKERRDRLDKEAKDARDREFDAREKERKDTSARGWASVSAQNKRIEAQDRKQKEYSKYQFEKINGAPEPKRIGEKRSIYVGRNTWEQNSGQIAGEIYKDLLDQDAKLAKEFYKSVNGGYGKKSADAKQTAALVDKYIMRSPRAQQLAIELEKDYKRRYELATDGSLTQNETDDLGFTPLSTGNSSNVDVDSLFD